jgi:hypothetical protein
MSDSDLMPAVAPDLTAALQQKADRLEREIAELRADADARLIRAELKAEAIRSGMVDMDGLRLIDTTDLSIQKDGLVTGAATLMEQFKRSKPWLFGNASSSNAGSPPPAQPSRMKLATEMTDAEYKTARAAILRQRA